MAYEQWPEIRADYERWVILGRLLVDRRDELGYGSMGRTRFARDRKVSIRRFAEIEKASPGRVNTWTTQTLKAIARDYEVTYASMVAVLRGEADELAPFTPDEPAPAGVSAHILPPAPMDDAGRENAVRPYATALWDQLLRLAAQGITDPSGAMLGLPPGDAKVWDGSAGAMSLADRAWLVADIQRRRDARTAADSRNGTATA